MNSLDETVHKAVMAHSLTALTEALSKGGAVDALDEAGRTPLFYAVKDGQRKIVEKLISSGANPNAQDMALETPLHFAARFYQIETAQQIIAAGANPNLADRHGNTPLWRAVFESRGRGEMIKLLLLSGADKALKNNSESSPEDLANNIGNYNLTGFLK